MRTNQAAINYDDYLDENLEDRARDKFLALPEFYSPKDAKFRYTNIDDAQGDIKQEEWIEIARALRDGDDLQAGNLLRKSLERICTNYAEEELENEWEAGKPEIDAEADRAEYLRQRARDAIIDNKVE